jgi:hypothetical protein
MLAEWKPCGLATLWAFMACYKDSFTFFTFLFAAAEMFAETLPSNERVALHIKTHKLMGGICEVGR